MAKIAVGLKFLVCFARVKKNKFIIKSMMNYKI